MRTARRASRESIIRSSVTNVKAQQVNTTSPPSLCSKMVKRLMRQSKHKLVQVYRVCVCVIKQLKHTATEITSQFLNLFRGVISISYRNFALPLRATQERLILDVCRTISGRCVASWSVTLTRRRGPFRLTQSLV